MDIKLITEKMDSSIKFFEKELHTLRTSRPNPSMLDNISADAYGAKTPINQLGNISAPDPINPAKIPAIIPVNVNPNIYIIYNI